MKNSRISSLNIGDDFKKEGIFHVSVYRYKFPNVLIICTYIYIHILHNELFRYLYSFNCLCSFFEARALRFGGKYLCWTPNHWKRLNWSKSWIECFVVWWLTCSSEPRKKTQRNDLKWYFFKPFLFHKEIPGWNSWRLMFFVFFFGFRLDSVRWAVGMKLLNLKQQPV